MCKTINAECLDIPKIRNAVKMLSNLIDLLEDDTQSNNPHQFHHKTQNIPKSQSLAKLSEVSLLENVIQAETDNLRRYLKKARVHLYSRKEGEKSSLWKTLPKTERIRLDCLEDSVFHLLRILEDRLPLAYSRLE